MANIDNVTIYGGSKRKISNKKLTQEKVKYSGRTHSVYVGPKGGKYIRKGGEFVLLK